MGDDFHLYRCRQDTLNTDGFMDRGDNWVWMTAIISAMSKGLMSLFYFDFPFLESKAEHLGVQVGKSTRKSEPLILSRNITSLSFRILFSSSSGLLFLKDTLYLGGWRHEWIQTSTLWLWCTHEAHLLWWLVDGVKQSANRCNFVWISGWIWGLAPSVTHYILSNVAK